MLGPQVRYLQGLNREALQLYREAVEIFQELEDPLNMAVCFKGVAFVAGASGHYSEAVQLLGAAAALRDSVGGVLPRMELADYEQHLEILRQKLGEALFVKAWQIGLRGKSEEILKKILPVLLH